MVVRPGVTLPEVLVVAGLIAVLVGIMFPIISSARNATRRTVCLAQQSDHMKVIFGYATDTRGTWPDASAEFLEIAPRSAELAGETLPELNDGAIAGGASALWPIAVIEAYDHQPFHRSLICPGDGTIEESAGRAESALGVPRTEVAGMQSYSMSTALLLDPKTLDPDTARPLRFAPQRVDRVAFPTLKAALYDRAPYHDPNQTDQHVVTPPYWLNVAMCDGSASERSTASATPGLATPLAAVFGIASRADEQAASHRTQLQREANKLNYTPHGVLGRDWNE